MGFADTGWPNGPFSVRAILSRSPGLLSYSNQTSRIGLSPVAIGPPIRKVNPFGVFASQGLRFKGTSVIDLAVVSLGNPPQPIEAFACSKLRSQDSEISRHGSYGYRDGLTLCRSAAGGRPRPTARCNGLLSSTTPQVQTKGQ